jgi:hypothetical protein
MVSRFFENPTLELIMYRFRYPPQIAYFLGFFAVLVFSWLGPASAQTAPNLTQYRVVAVASPQFRNATGLDYDMVPNNALATPSDHGGGGIIVVVLEFGYGSAFGATFNGAPMTLIRSDRIIGSGNIIIGWYRYYYSATNYTRGEFRSTARQGSMPWRDLFTRISVR